MLFTSVGAIVLLLLVSAFFSSSETALTAVSRGRMHQLEKDGSRAARAVNRLVANREKLIGAVLLGNTFVNILASSLATQLLEDRFGHRAVVVATRRIMTVVILVFAEVLPKTLAIAHTDALALALAPPLKRIVSVLAPIVGAVQWVVWRVLWLFGVRQEQNTEENTEAAHEEIRGALALHHQEGSFEREHRDMIGASWTCANSKSRCCAPPHPYGERRCRSAAGRNLAQVTDANHTRIPLWRGTRKHYRRASHQGSGSGASRKQRRCQKGRYRRACVFSPGSCLTPPPWKNSWRPSGNGEPASPGRR
jgi:Mg2+/Co2+ transporter CorB